MTKLQLLIDELRITKDKEIEKSWETTTTKLAALIRDANIANREFVSVETMTEHVCNKVLNWAKEQGFTEAYKTTLSLGGQVVLIPWSAKPLFDHTPDITVYGDGKAKLVKAAQTEQL